VYRKFECMLPPHIQASYILKWVQDVYCNVCSVTDAIIWSLFSFHTVCRFYFLFHTLRFPFHIYVTYCVTQLKYADVLTSCELWTKSRKILHELKAAEHWENTAFTACMWYLVLAVSVYINSNLHVISCHHFHLTMPFKDLLKKFVFFYFLIWM